MWERILETKSFSGQLQMLCQPPWPKIDFIKNSSSTATYKVVILIFQFSLFLSTLLAHQVFVKCLKPYFAFLSAQQKTKKFSHKYLIEAAPSREKIAGIKCFSSET